MNEFKDEFKDEFKVFQNLIDRFPNPSSPFLQRFKIEFGIFHNNEKKVYKIIDNDIDGIIGDDIEQLKLKCQEHKIDFDNQNISRYHYASNLSFWKILFIIESEPAPKAKAALIYIQKSLISSNKNILIGEIVFNGNKSLSQYSQDEVLATNFNYSLPSSKILIQYQLKIINEFLQEYEGINHDEEHLIKLKSQKNKTSKNNPITNNFYPMPFDRVKEHFTQLVTEKSANTKSFLSEQDLEIFLNAAFIENTPLSRKLIFNMVDGEMKIIQNVFYSFYFRSRREYEKTRRGIQSKYLNLLKNNFEGFTNLDGSNFAKYYVKGR